MGKIYSTESKCATCEYEGNFDLLNKALKTIPGFNCLDGYSYDILKKSEAYTGWLKDLARKSNISVYSDKSDEKIEIELIKKGKGDELAKIRERYLKEKIEPVKNSLEASGLTLEHTSPFNSDVPLQVKDCPFYNPNRKLIEEIKILEESEGDF